MKKKEQPDKEYMRRLMVRRITFDRRRFIMRHQDIFKFEGQDKRDWENRRSGEDRRVLVK